MICQWCTHYDSDRYRCEYAGDVDPYAGTCSEFENYETVVFDDDD